jgi:hypothetical protein
MFLMLLVSDCLPIYLTTRFPIWTLPILVKFIFPSINFVRATIFNPHDSRSRLIDFFHINNNAVKVIEFKAIGLGDLRTEEASLWCIFRLLIPSNYLRMAFNPMLCAILLSIFCDIFYVSGQNRKLDRASRKNEKV